MLGLNMKTEIFDSLTAEQTNYDNSPRNEEDEDSSSIATGEDSSNLVSDMNLPKETKRLNAKRKREEEDVEEHPVSKKPNTEKDEVIRNLNNIISHLAPPFQNQQSEEIQANKPLLVPLKYLPALLGFIEKRKIEKRLEELIEAYVKKHLLQLKSQRRTKKNDKQLMNGFASPVIQADPKNFKQGPSTITQRHHSS